MSVSQYYQKISDDQFRQELCQMRAGGLAWSKIAKLYDIGNSTLYNAILSKGWKLGEFPIGNEPLEIPQDIDKAFVRGRRETAWKVPDDFEQQTREMRARGYTWVEIARYYHTSADSIKRAIAFVGLSACDFPAPTKPRLERRKAPNGSTLCWECANAVPNPKLGTGCSWSIGERFIPVEGWVASKYCFKVNDGVGTVTETYTVHACPQFVKG